MIDLHADRDAYAVHGISNVGFTSASNNPADVRSKIGMFHALYRLLLTGKCNFIVEQLFIRCQNGVTPANYLSTASIFYLPLCV